MCLVLDGSPRSLDAEILLSSNSSAYNCQNLVNREAREGRWASYPTQWLLTTILVRKAAEFAGIYDEPPAP